MTSRQRANPLALAVLTCLNERPMHPYEAATTLRQRNRHESVRLNYGSLYAVFASLEKRGLIAAAGVSREGRLPVRTSYELTAAGNVELHDWLTELLGTPVKEYPGFEAALALLPALPPEKARALLVERADQLEVQLAKLRAAHEVSAKRGLPRLFWVESEFHAALLDAELAYVRGLTSDITEGTLDGLRWWREIHEDDGPAPDQVTEASDQPEECEETP